MPFHFFCRSAEEVAPDLIGCRLVKKNPKGKLLWGVIVETEAYSEDEPACHGFNRRSKKNETLFGEPGRFYVYLTYGVHHCVNVVTDKNGFANGVLLRALAIPSEPERIASGPGLLARRFGIDLRHDSLRVTGENDLLIASPSSLRSKGIIVNTTRIGISKAKDLPWRWYMQSSRSVSKRVAGDKCPSLSQAWIPSVNDSP